MLKPLVAYALVAAPCLTLMACGHATPRVTPFPHGEAIELFDAPVHLGDNLYDDQSLTFERVQAALQRSGGNESLASRELGVSRGKLRRFLAASGR